MPEALTSDALATHLEQLPGWQVEAGNLVKEFAFTSYMAGIHFSQQVAEIAETLNHHPDILITWRRARVSIHTHSAKAITALDVDFAKQVEQLPLPVT